LGIVCNAGPLISLARIGRLDLLPALFGEIIVPPGVHREVTNDVSLPGAKDLAGAKWLKLAKVQDRSSVERLLSSLDPGEAEVLILARELAATAAIDEKRGRHLAADLGVLQTGTIGILLAAKREGWSHSSDPCLINSWRMESDSPPASMRRPAVLPASYRSPST
jgi:predicted nucleic acid-binding protein